MNQVPNIEEKLYCVYYIKGWKGWIYDIFIKHVYPEIKKGWDNHKRLIEKGSIAHANGGTCIICKP